MNRTSIFAITLVFLAFFHTLILTADARDEPSSRVVDGRRLILKKIRDLSTEGNVRINVKSDVSVSDDQNGILAGRTSSKNVFIPLNPMYPSDEQIGPIRVLGWNRPILVPQSVKVVTKTWDFVMVNAPSKGRVNQLARMPHEMCEGDWIDPVVSPRGDILATRPAINEVQFWDLKTLKPLTSPVKQPGPVSRISFSSDGKYFRVHSGDRLSILNPSTGDLVAGPFQTGPFRYYPSSPGVGYSRRRPRAAYEPVAERIVCFQNEGSGTKLSCKAVIRSLGGKTEPVMFELPVHAYQASWIDSDHLLVQGGRKLETNWYNTYPLMVVSLKSGTPTVKEWHPDIDHYGISSDDQHVVATKRSGPFGRCLCWKVGNPKPLWNEPGCFAGFGKDGWVLTHDRGRTATIRAMETGTALWEKPEVLIAIPKGQYVWLFFDNSFQSWKAEWKSVDRKQSQ